MDGDLYQSELVKAYMFVQVLRDMPLAEMHQAVEHCHSIGPIVDPTLYRDRQKAMSQDGDVIRILLRAQVELNKLPWPQAAPSAEEDLTAADGARTEEGG